MRTLWVIKLYHVSEKTGFKVKLEGDTRPGQPWAHAEGKGKTPAEALDAAADEMATGDRESLRKFLHGK